VFLHLHLSHLSQIILAQRLLAVLKVLELFLSLLIDQESEEELVHCHWYVLEYVLRPQQFAEVDHRFAQS
jgi:hypothetical protein